MLETIAVILILIILWLLGFVTSYTMGGHSRPATVTTLESPYAWRRYAVRCFSYPFF